MKRPMTVASFIFACMVFVSSAGAENASIEVTDCISRKVTIPSKIERIACLYAFSGHVVTMLGRGGDIVAVVKGLKRDVMLISICPSIEKAAVPNLNDAMNIEELARTKPDVVFLREAAASRKNQTDILDKLGIPWVVIAFNSIEGQKNAVAIIGRTIGREKDALEYNRYFDECIARTKKIAAAVPPVKRVRLYHAILEPLKAPGSRSISAEWTAIAGTVNVSAQDETGDREGDQFVNIEQVLLWNPDVIIANEEGTPEFIMTSKQWSTVKAVRDGRVYKMPTGISRWGHPGSLETPLALLWTVKNVYPEYASFVDMKRETVLFYKKFFRYDLDDRTAEKILLGKGLRKSKNKGKR